MSIFYTDEDANSHPHIYNTNQNQTGWKKEIAQHLHVSDWRSICFNGNTFCVQRQFYRIIQPWQPFSSTDVSCSYGRIQQLVVWKLRKNLQNLCLQHFNIYYIYLAHMQRKYRSANIKCHVCWICIRTEQFFILQCNFLNRKTNLTVASEANKLYI